MAVPRVLHHQHFGHRYRGQDPPRARDHRAGPRRSQRLRLGSSAVEIVRRQCCVARAGRHRVQPHQSCGSTVRTGTGKGDHRYDPPHPDRSSRTDRRLGTNADPAPTDRVALANQLERTVNPDLRTSTDQLTDGRKPDQEHSESRQTGGPTAPDSQKSPEQDQLLGSMINYQAGRWIRAKQNSDYAQSTADKLATYQQDTQNAKDEHDKKTADLQGQLDEELAFRQKHSADLAGINAADAKDQVDKLVQSHNDQLAQLELQRQRVVAKAAQTGNDAINAQVGAT